MDIKPMDIKNKTKRNVGKGLNWFKKFLNRLNRLNRWHKKRGAIAPPLNPR